MPIERRQRVRFAYIGDEQSSWGRQAFVLPRHYYVMPGILYLEAMLKERADELGVSDVGCLYFNRAIHDVAAMTRALADQAPDIVGLSCYAWNLEDSLKLAAALKERLPGIRVVAGGPSVSFDDSAEAERFLATAPVLDAILFGEGEGAICDLTAALVEGRGLGQVANVTWRDGERAVSTPRAPALRDLDLIPEISPAAVPVERTPGAGIVIVYQTYRGCPYSCVYCSFHGGSQGIRRFAVDRVEREIGRVLDARPDVIHFADPVFELVRDRAKRLFRFMNGRNRGTALFIYTGFLNLDEELTALIEESRVQCEVGLQSMDAAVLDRIRRRFDLEKFAAIARNIAKRRINWYVDLMFGLPGEDMQGFANTISQVMDLRIPFFMMYPLTVIPRTELGRDIERFGVIRYADDEVRATVKSLTGIVYADIGLYKAFALRDLARFENLCVALYFAFRRYPMTFDLLSRYARATAACGHDIEPFTLFDVMGVRLRERCEATGYTRSEQWPHTEDTFRETFLDLARKMGATEIEGEAVLALVVLESGIDFLLTRVDRRGQYLAAKAREPRLLDAIPAAVDGATVAFRGSRWAHDLPFSFDDIVSLPERPGRIERRPVHLLALAPWDDWKVEPVEISQAEKVICEEIPELREMPLAALVRRMARRAPGASWQEALARLVALEVVGVYRPAGA